MSERFLYEIRPNRPVNFPGVGRTIMPQTALLTKEEALDYLTYGPVYRKYTEVNIPPVRVNGENINLLHQPYKMEQKNNISVSDVLSQAKEVIAEPHKETAIPKKLNEGESIQNNIDEPSINKEVSIEETIPESVEINESESSTVESTTDEAVETANNGIDIEEDIDSDIEVDVAKEEKEDVQIADESKNEKRNNYVYNKNYKNVQFNNNKKRH